jgi:hypothetical protein
LQKKRLRRCRKPSPKMNHTNCPQGADAKNMTMKTYKCTLIKTGKVSIVTEERKSRIIANGFGSDFRFEEIAPAKMPKEVREKVAELKPETDAQDTEKQ